MVNRHEQTYSSFNVDFCRTVTKIFQSRHEIQLCKRSHAIIERICLNTWNAIILKQDTLKGKILWN